LQYKPPRPLVNGKGSSKLYQPHEELEELVRPALQEQFEANIGDFWIRTIHPCIFSWVGLGQASQGMPQNSREHWSRVPMWVLS